MKSLPIPSRAYGKLAVVAAITVVVFYAIVKQFDAGALPSLFRQANLFWIVLGTLFGFVTSPFLNAARWYAILSGGSHSVKFKKVLAITVANWPFMVIPGRVGDLLKSYPLRHEIPVSHSIVSIIIEKIIDVLALLGIIALGALFLGKTAILIISSGLFLAGIVAVFFANLISRRFLAKIVPEGKTRDALTHFDHFLNSLIRRPAYFSLAILSSVGNWLTNVFAVWCFYNAFSLTVPFTAILTYLPISIFIGLLPVTVAGMGTRDAALIQFFANYAGSAQSLGVGILYSLSAYWLPVVAGLFFIYTTGLSSSFWPQSIDSQKTS